ncbi:MAG TPA: DUF4214 domain-containing protein [Acidimicrobiales bacterium]|nr:DUF4214 domain-containing protein [Acidimicrobiales bacterium]
MRRISLLALGLSLTGLVTVSGSATAAPDRPTRVAAGTAAFPNDAYPAYDLGVQNRPPGVDGRDAGHSALIGETSLWAYGDTAGPGKWLTNTGATNVQGFLDVNEPVDAGGFSRDLLVPFTSAESAANAAAATAGEKYWIWPQGIIARPTTQSSLVFWERGRVDLAVGYGQVGLADVHEGDTVAVRRAALFTAQDCSWIMPVLGSDSYVYLYGAPDEPGKDRTNCPNRGSSPAGSRMVARAPLSQAGTKSAYTYWTGTTWATSPMTAVPVFSMVTPQVSWSDGLGAYLAIGGYLNDSTYRTAPSPQGPWSAEQPWITPAPGATGWGNYAWINHPEHAGADGGVLLTSYFRSTAANVGEHHLLAVDTRSNPATHLADYIDRTFQEMLGRAATSSDITYWSGQLTARTQTVSTFTRSLARSSEGLRYRVGQAYQAVLQRAASSSERSYWATQMADNGWGYDILVAKIASSAEMSGQFSTTGAYVDAVYLRTLDRAADSAGRAYWVGQLDSNAVSRYTFVRSLVQSDESGRHQADLAYQDILGRPATVKQQGAVSAMARDALLIRHRVAATAEAIGA